MNGDSDLSPKEIGRRLSGLESDTARRSERSSVARAAMLAEFDAAVADVQDNASADDPADLETGTIDVLPIEGQPRQARRRVVPALLAAAACVLLIASIATLAISQFGGDELEQVGTQPVTPTPTRPTLPELPAGLFVTDRVAGGVQFEIPAGLALTVDDPGLVRLVPTTSEFDDEASSVTLQDSPVTADDLAASIRGMEVAGNVVATQSEVDGPDGVVTQWELQLPPTFFCSGEPQCRYVPVLSDMEDPPRLRQDAPTYMTVVEVGTGNALVVERRSGPSDPIATAGALILRTLRTTE